MQNKSETKVYNFNRFISVKKQVAESIPTSKLGTHTQEEGTQQASWQRPAALQRTKGSSGEPSASQKPVNPTSRARKEKMAEEKRTLLQTHR